MKDAQRVAVVTGANRGLGQAIARRLAEQGLHVVLTARSAEAANRAAEGLQSEGLSASGHQLDVTWSGAWQTPHSTAAASMSSLTTLA